MANAADWERVERPADHAAWDDLAREPRADRPGERPVVPAPAHTFHIPVMGTGFMIDAPLRVARYGISSVVSLVDDVLIEQMRRFHCDQAAEPYEPITDADDDPRAHRITAYLDLLNRLIHRQVEQLQASPFEPGSEITRYFEMLPDGPRRHAYCQMQATEDPADRRCRQEQLRRWATPGSIDVNIMSKGDRDIYRKSEKLPAMYSDASAALRGFAKSTLASAIIFSAGFNPRLYGYTAEFDDFLPDRHGVLKKRIILKVSDFHSAAVQGRFLAKRGLWVSEYRIESGLNCGGHTFATQGLLLGPILAEFREKKRELVAQLHTVYLKALRQRGHVLEPVAIAAEGSDSAAGSAGSSATGSLATTPPPVRLTVQGGIGTAAEDKMLREHYAVDGTGWATPFLLVPEVTCVDKAHLEMLRTAADGEVYLSESSPFGLPIWNLRCSASEQARRRRIAEGQPGSPCTKGYVRLFNTEFTPMPICTASRQYQRFKLHQIEQAAMSEARRESARSRVLEKACICHDLAGGATLKYGIDPQATPAVCCGPNIVNFSKIATLEEMVAHIYGRGSLPIKADRPHMFVREAALYVAFLRREIERQSLGLSANTPKYCREFQANLREGIEYYRHFAAHLDGDARPPFLAELARLDEEIQPLAPAC
jgi:hypothetical protein